MNVLCLGGPSSWGTMLSDRKKAYSTLLKELRPDVIKRVDNLAIRGDDSLLPSLCLESLVKNAQEQRGEGAYDYHVVTLEYSQRGHTNLDMVVERIRNRWPTAVIIYIDLYSNRRPCFTNCLAETCKMSRGKRSEILRPVFDVGGTGIALPRPYQCSTFAEVKKWFSPDMYHLNEVGHKYIADAIFYKLSEIQQAGHLKEPHPAGTWGSGDKCYGDALLRDWISLDQIVQV